MRCLLILWLLLGLAAGSPILTSSAQAEDAGACDLPTDLLTPSAPLPHVAQSLRKGQLSILAVGSGSTIGDTGNTNGAALAYRIPGASFPFRMAEALRAVRPGLQVNLTVNGGRSLTAGDMLPIIRSEIKRAHFDLVVWQTGTVEAVHGDRPDELRNNLVDGANMVQASGADLVLVDAQFSRFLRANANIELYQSVLRQASGLDNVTLFPRLDLTQGWVNSGQIDLENVERDARDRTITLLNTCLGRALAQFVMAGAAQN